MSPRKPGYIPRPENSFMLFKRYNWNRVMNSLPEKTHSKVAIQMIAAEWKAAGAEIKQHYKMLADRVKRDHAAMHPGYKYQPRRKRKSRAVESNETGGSNIPSMVQPMSETPEFGWESYPGQQGPTPPIAMEGHVTYFQQFSPYSGSPQPPMYVTYPEPGPSVPNQYGQPDVYYDHVQPSWSNMQDMHFDL